MSKPRVERSKVITLQDDKKVKIPVQGVVHPAGDKVVHYKRLYSSVFGYYEHIHQLWWQDSRSNKLCQERRVSFVVEVNDAQPRSPSEDVIRQARHRKPRRKTKARRHEVQEKVQKVVNAIVLWSFLDRRWWALRVFDWSCWSSPSNRRQFFKKNVFILCCIEYRFMCIFKQGSGLFQVFHQSLNVFVRRKLSTVGFSWDITISICYKSIVFSCVSFALRYHTGSISRVVVFFTWGKNLQHVCMSQSLVVLQRCYVVTIFMFVDTFRLVPDGLIVVFLIFQRSSLRFSVRMLLFCLSVAIVTDHTLRLAICSGIRHSSGQDSFSVFPFSLVGIRLSTYGIQLFSYIQLSVCLSLTYPESMELPSTVQRCLLYVSLAFRSVIFCIGISPLHLLASILTRM